MSRRTAQPEPKSGFPLGAGRLHRKGSDGAVPADVDGVLRSGGAPLDAAALPSMESRFGRDFSAVRVHTGPRAEESARAVDAQAYTVGRRLRFRIRESQLTVEEVLFTGAASDVEVLPGEKGEPA